MSIIGRLLLIINSYAKVKPWVILVDVSPSASLCATARCMGVSWVCFAPGSLERLFMSSFGYDQQFMSLSPCLHNWTPSKIDQSIIDKLMLKQTDEGGNIFVWLYQKGNHHWILIGCKTRSFSTFWNCMLISGILTRTPQSDFITGWMKRAAFLPFQDSLNFFEQPNYDLYPQSMFKACFTDLNSLSMKKDVP